MENQETNINLGPEPLEKVVYVIYTEVDKLYLDKSTKTWYAHFLGSWESLAFGEEKPFNVGAKIKITFEEVTDNASPSYSSDRPSRVGQEHDSSASSQEPT